MSAVHVDIQWENPVYQKKWSALCDTDVITRAITTAIGYFDVPICEVSVMLVGNDFIQNLNAQYRHKDTPTNVLSFPARDAYMLDGMVENLGDIVIAYETVVSEAMKQEKPLASHFIHLVVHGVLHVLGMDHITPEHAQEMEDLERNILKKLGIDDPYLEKTIET